MSSRERAVREIAGARRRGDFEAVRRLLADDVVWHEPGDADYSGDHVGAETVVAMMKRLHELTDGTFVCEPQQVVATEEHAAARTRWRADRDSVHVEGTEIAVYRFAGEQIAEVWFWYAGYDEAAHDVVFDWARMPGHDSYWQFHRDRFLELVPPAGRRKRVGSPAT